jgi:predicted ATPase
MDGAQEARSPRRPDRSEIGVFVGREKELTVLRAAVDDALAGRGRLVLLAGEPGIGKTRTAQELAAVIW